MSEKDLQERYEYIGRLIRMILDEVIEIIRLKTQEGKDADT